MPLPAGLEEWYEHMKPHLARARDDVLENVNHFVADWSEPFGFRCERAPSPRVKSVDRVAAKCLAKGIEADFDQLLAQPYAVGDLVGVRFVVRSRADVEAVVEALGNQSSLGYYNIEDLSDTPTSTGYRALHVNGSSEIVVREVPKTIPFELQVKTLAQDAWGYFTHDTAYVPTEVNQHPRFAPVQDLQRLLADMLHNVDLLQQHIEVQAEQIAHEVAAAADPNEVMFGNVQRIMRDTHDVRLSVSEAQRLVRLAHEAGVADIAQFERARRSEPTRGDRVRRVVSRRP